MLLSRRSLRHSVLGLLWIIPGVCAAQGNQFLNLPKVQPTAGGGVTSFSTGILQQPTGGTDIMYVKAPVVSGATTSITFGELLNQGGAGFADLGENQIVFQGVSNLVAAQSNFLGFPIGYAFALTPSVPGLPNLCIYAGTGAQPPSNTNPAGGGTSYSGGNVYPPTSGSSGCMTLPTLGGSPPQFGYIAAFPFKPGFPPQLIVEDTANNYLYILSLTGASEIGGVLNGIVITAAIQLPAADGAGPLYIGDFNGDGKMDFIVNYQAGSGATVYLGDGAGGLAGPPVRYVFGGGVRSMLMQDMDGDGKPDMVVENKAGVIEIHKGLGDGTFQTSVEGGTAPAPGSAAGEGGRLAAINPRTLDILTATPIGLSVLQRQNGTLVYALKAIYNIGPGRNSFALVDFHGTGSLEFAVDSAEGVAIFAVNSDGTLQASNAYSALAPALGTAVGVFRNVNLARGIYDVVVGTGAVQGRILFGDGAGAFTAATSPTNLIAGQMANPPPAGLWSNIFAGGFNGDHSLDIAYSLTGLPLPAPGSGAGPGLYVQYGNGDGTFQNPTPVTPSSVGAPAANTFYGESSTGFFGEDGMFGIVNIDSGYVDTLLGQNTNSFKLGLNATVGNTAFNQVAAGDFKVSRGPADQDLVVEQGASFIPYVNTQDGTGTNFKAMPALTGPGAPLYASSVGLADVDGDGNSDLVVLYFNGAANASTTSLYIWYGKGDGTFEQPQVLTLSRNYYLGVVVDMNADGRPDLVLSDGSLVSILYYQGGRSFGTLLPSGLHSSEQHFLAGQGINSIQPADVNGDGIPDLIVANGGVTISNPVALGGRTASSLALTVNPSDINTGGITVLLNSITTAPVTGTLVASPEPSGFGAAFTLTATITPSAGVALPTGVVQFYVDTVPVGPLVNLVRGSSNSTATYTIPAGNNYASGIHPIAASYFGDTLNSPFALTGPAGTHVITSGGSTTTELFLCVGPTPACPSTGVINPTPPYIANLTMYYGQTWNGITDVFANDNSTLTGTLNLIDVYNGVTQPSLCTLIVGQLIPCPPSVGTTVGTSAGVHVLTSVYSGDSAHTGSTSKPVTITVLQDTTTASLIGAPNPSPAGQLVVFTATLTGNFAPPTGTVVFTYGSTVLGTGALVANPGGVSSSAAVVTSALPVGADTITATYAATLDFAAASASFVETITPPLSGNFTLTVAPNPVSVGVGYSTLLTVTVTPQNGFSQDVKLACANLPSEATCFFDTTTLAGGGGTTSLVVGTTAPHSCGTTQPYFVGTNGGGPGIGPIALPAIAGLLAMFMPGRRRWLRALIALIVVAGATQMTGCGTCSDLGTRPATYTIQVTASSSSTTEVESQPVTITVTI